MKSARTIVEIKSDGVKIDKDWLNMLYSDLLFHKGTTNKWDLSEINSNRMLCPIEYFDMIYYSKDLDARIEEYDSQMKGLTKSDRARADSVLLLFVISQSELDDLTHVSTGQRPKNTAQRDKSATLLRRSG